MDQASQATRRRRDLVLGMSLAEIVLLLLFGFFLVYALPSGEAQPGEPIDVRALREAYRSLKGRVAHIEDSLEKLRDEVEGRDRIIEHLRKMSGGLGKIETPADVEKAVAAIKRGAPACLSDNTILQVTVRRGSLEAIYFSEDYDLAAFFREHGLSVQKGRAVAEIWRFLGIIDRYYQKRGKDCRFDYRLFYVTGDDYHYARERIERHLYHAGRPTQIPG